MIWKHLLTINLLWAAKRPIFQYDKLRLVGTSPCKVFSPQTVDKMLKKYYNEKRL